jgi:hypothetical protein
LFYENRSRISVRENLSRRCNGRDKLRCQDHDGWFGARDLVSTSNLEKAAGACIKVHFRDIAKCDLIHSPIRQIDRTDF